MKTSLFLALACAGLTSVGASHATTWDANADFTSSTTTNPNGVWSYGHDSPSLAGYQFVAFNTLAATQDLLLWNDSNYNTLNAPAFFKNLGAPSNGIPSGAIGLHAGPASDGDPAILRFTVPATATYQVDAQFFVGDAGTTYASVILDNNFSSPLGSLGSTDTNPTFSAGLRLTAGETLDFIVANNGSFFSGSTPLTVTISAVPEPATAALLGLGALLMGLARRRRADA